VSGWPGCDGGKQPPSEFGALALGKQGGAYNSQFIITRRTRAQPVVWWCVPTPSPAGRRS